MSKTKVDLGRHGFATLHDPADVSERSRRAVQRAQVAMEAFVHELRGRGVIPADIDLEDAPPQVTEEIGRRAITEAPDLMDAVNDTQIAALVAEWPFERPVTAETAAELPGDAYDMLKVACDELAPLLRPKLHAPTPAEDGPHTPFVS